MMNLSAFIRFHATRAPEREAIIYNTQRISYRELFARILAVAAILRNLGVQENGVVAVFMKNSPAFLEIAFAASHLGAIFVPINFRLTGSECRYIVEKAGAKFLLADEEFVDVLSGIDVSVWLTSASQDDARLMGPRDLPMPDMVVRQPGDLFRLMFTSGTTDLPKGVMHSYMNYYWKTNEQLLALNLSSKDRLLIVGPLYHVSGFDFPGVGILWLGGTIILHRNFQPQRVLEDIEHERINCAWFAPIMVGRLLSHAQRRRYDLSSFQWCLAGGERTPETRVRAFSGLFPNGRLLDGYGLTETCSADALMEPGREIDKIGSVGRPLAHVELTIRDEDDVALGPMQEGEICLRGPKVMSGYWNDAERTAKALRGGWFRSGDVGYLDADGFLFITDRKKDMIISGGENISSTEIERVLYMRPEVADVAVIGVPDAEWGERPVAVIVLAPGHAVDTPRLQEHCLQHLAKFKMPRAFFARDELPRNPSGKVLKRQLRDELSRQSTAGSPDGRVF